MRTIIKSLMFAGVAMVMGSANAVEPVATDSTASATSLTVEQQQLLEDIVDQTGLRDGKLDGRAVTKENVIDAMRRTVESYKKASKLLERIMSDVQQVLPEGSVEPRGMIYGYKDKKNLDYDKLLAAREKDITKEKESTKNSIDSYAFGMMRDITKCVYDYLHADSKMDKRSAANSLQAVLGKFAGEDFGANEALFKTGVIRQSKDGSWTISDKHFRNDAGDYLSKDELFDKLIDIIADNGYFVNQARKVEILALKKQSKANWYSREIRPALQKIKREKVIESE